MRVNLAQQIFAIVPAKGKGALSAGQRNLLVGKAALLRAAHVAGFAAVPTIAITRAAWLQLQAERGGGTGRLRAQWVATLFKLVGKGQQPPLLVVRTSAPKHIGGLMRARTAIPAPANEIESVDPALPLARALNEAFESYGAVDMAWGTGEHQAERENQIVIVQALATGRFTEFATRDIQTGAIGPTQIERARLGSKADDAAKLAAALDAHSGKHLMCHVELGSHLRLLSARALHASAEAELEAAVDRVESGVWTPHQAVLATDPERLPQLLHSRLSADVSAQSIATGVGVSPGAASGQIVFTSEDAARANARGKQCILVVAETGPADIDGMTAATGILTARGGQNSHAAIIARVSGKPCVAGTRGLEIDLDNMICRIGDTHFGSGANITIDGSDGKIYFGKLPLSEPHIGGAIAKLLDWSDASRTIAVRANVETVESAKTALSFGAEGIGLARSEHMFFTPERLLALRRMILSQSEEDRGKALQGLIDYQRGDYADLFAVMRGKPVTVRLFDPPLHEFLPRGDEDIAETASALSIDERALRRRLERLAESNPMLGHRGCRLIITYPEILDMQIRALIAGARDALKGQDEPLDLEIMVPFVTSQREVALVREQIFKIAESEKIFDDSRVRISFGTMIELPRAALRADDIAPLVDFFSFGTNDLTQTTFGISRDDAPAFLATYQRKGLYDGDPFTTLDKRGVGELIKIAIERGKAANPDLKIGICGEHAGDPESLAFFAELGVNYVSCSPYRIPVARLALAQSERKNA